MKILKGNRLDFTSLSLKPEKHPKEMPLGFQIPESRLLSDPNHYLNFVING